MQQQTNTNNVSREARQLVYPASSALRLRCCAVNLSVIVTYKASTTLVPKSLFLQGPRDTGEFHSLVLAKFPRDPGPGTVFECSSLLPTLLLKLASGQRVVYQRQY